MPGSLSKQSSSRPASTSGPREISVSELLDKHALHHCFHGNRDLFHKLLPKLVDLSINELTGPRVDEAISVLVLICQLCLTHMPKSDKDKFSKTELDVSIQ